MEGYNWAVYPAVVKLAMTATGVTDAEAVAQMLVEAILAADPEAIFGTVTCPDGRQLACRRSREPGQFVWHPLFEDISSQVANRDVRS